MAEPIGPFPAGADPEQYDRLRRRALWRMPSGLYLLGTAAGGRRNLMTHSWAMQVAMEPKLLAVSVRVDAVSHALLEAGRVFSLSLVRREDRALVRSFTKPVAEGPGPDELGGQRVRYGATGAPVPESAPVWFECEVRSSLPTGDHTVFVGEVVDCAVPDEEVPLLRMEDTRLNYGG
jgi:flavin reductase (DIM6/NTAB) family NADH-FMN oxidoreductase RutF